MDTLRVKPTSVDIRRVSRVSHAHSSIEDLSSVPVLFLASDRAVVPERARDARARTRSSRDRLFTYSRQSDSSRETSLVPNYRLGIIPLGTLPGGEGARVCEQFAIRRLAFFRRFFSFLLFSFFFFPTKRIIPGVVLGGSLGTPQLRRAAHGRRRRTALLSVSTN